MSNLDKYIENLEKEFVRNSLEGFSAISKEQKLLYLYGYYHYFNADNSKLSDIIQGYVFDHSSADKIAGLYIDSDSDSGNVDAIIVEIVPEESELDFPISLKAMKDAESSLLKCTQGYSFVSSSLV